MIVLPLWGLCLRLTTRKLLAPSYTNALPLHNLKWGFAQHLRGHKLRFRHNPMDRSGGWKVPAPMC
jgi:hypothetical protein